MTHFTVLFSINHLFTKYYRNENPFPNPIHSLTNDQLNHRWSNHPRIVSCHKTLASFIWPFVYTIPVSLCGGCKKDRPRFFEQLTEIFQVGKLPTRTGPQGTAWKDGSWKQHTIWFYWDWAPIPVSSWNGGRTTEGAGCRSGGFLQ